MKAVCLGTDEESSLGLWQQPFEPPQNVAFSFIEPPTGEQLRICCAAEARGSAPSRPANLEATTYLRKEPHGYSGYLSSGQSRPGQARTGWDRNAANLGSSFLQKVHAARWEEATTHGRQTNGPWAQASWRKRGLGRTDHNFCRSATTAACGLPLRSHPVTPNGARPANVVIPDAVRELLCCKQEPTYSTTGPAPGLSPITVDKVSERPRPSQQEGAQNLIDNTRL
ncbi:hypothetical protein B0T17DRAFT_507256 [Bombardia bombarda]|uniref:Uncharacterized protein n=1 Tax=Bombardia bombarda TaxID=252184 RepID=A0AA39XBT0_9PEZI|nr:hypothetical protein B0T17DRAFT_507256 [Bombardia bombarda]